MDQVKQADRQNTDEKQRAAELRWGLEEHKAAQKRIAEQLKTQKEKK